MAGYAAACRWLTVVAAAGFVPPPPEPPPSVEMLLYLAEFGDAQGRHLDPASIDDPAAVDGDDGKTSPGTKTDDTDDPPPDRHR